MPRSTKKASGLLSLSDALNLLTVEQLKERLALLPDAASPTRKAELVAELERHLSGEPLQALWNRLDNMQQHAVRETLYAAEARFNAQTFRAKFGQLPNFGTQKNRWSYSLKPSLLRLFLYSEERYSDTGRLIPTEMQSELRRFVQPPKAPKLPTIEEPPEQFELRESTYELAEGDRGITLIAGKSVYTMPTKPPKVETTVQSVPVTRRNTEHAAQHDLATVLRLVDQGKVAVSAKTLRPTAATVNAIAAVLFDGDFFVEPPKRQGWEDPIGPIKAYAWPWLVQAANLAQLQGTKLALTKAGRTALSAPTAKTLRLIWQRWLKTTLLDEFNRIDTIKGQQGRGKRSMTAVARRRPVIVEALKQCPVGSWVQCDDFSRFMQAAGFTFEITREPWDLYIEDANYGSLGHSGYHDWHLLQGRYILCLLFEYAATLGLLDVAYIAPHGARPDYGELWGTDDLDFLSRYDGLLAFRLNPLGAFCLGLTSHYVPSQREVQESFTILPSLRIQLTDQGLAPDAMLLLETYAAQEAETVWRLDRDKTLAAVESGHQMDELREFLTLRDPQPLPETVESFLLTTERQARALVHRGTALLIECADADIAALIATHAHTKQLCLRAGERHLVVQTGAEESFRKALHELGYGLPRG